MSKKSGENTAPSNIDDAWKAEERAVDELLGLVKALKVCVTATGSVRNRSRFRAAEATAKMREAVTESLGTETRAFNDWAQLADQPKLFSEDELAPRATFPPTRGLKN